MNTTRRSLLTGAAAGLAALGLPRAANAALSGDTTIHCGPYKVLEIVLTGALSHRDALWVDDPAENWAPWRVDPTMSAVAPAATGAQKILFLPALDHAVYLGAGFTPLSGSDALQRTRLLALYAPGPDEHVLRTAHTLCGIEVGRPGFASSGARVAGRYLDGASVLPSWVVDGRGNAQYVQFATATGILGAQYKPFVVPVGDEGFKAQLDRTDYQHVDSLMAGYRKRYANRLTQGSHRVRSDGFDAYEDAVTRLIDWGAVRDVLNHTDAPNLTDDFSGFESNRTTVGVRFAGHLLNQGARHVTVIGGGAGDVFLDTHDNGGADFQFHAIRHNGTVWGVMNALRDMLDDGVLDLDDTMVVLRSEFGREERDNDGTEHNIRGYAGVLIGGPVAAPSLGGRLQFDQPDDAEHFGRAVGGFSPTDVAAAVALAAGVDPFQPGLFVRSDLTEPGANDQAAREWLATDLLDAATGGNPNSCIGDIAIP